jgi:very-short-patch-repair endonuclease
VDFYCPEVNLVLEIDGDTHAWDDAQNYDAMRSQLIELYGLQIIRVTNSDVYKKFDDVCCYISDCVDEVCN